MTPAGKRLLGGALALCLTAGVCTDSRDEKNAKHDERSSVSAPVATDPLTGPVFHTACALPLKLLRSVRRGYYPDRSPEIVAIPDQPNSFGSMQVTTHSGPWDYLQQVPLVLYGPGFIKAHGELFMRRQVTLADVAPTLASLLRTPWPRARPGRPLTKALVPETERAGGPRLIVVVVWDGGGWNVLNRWPGRWPNLRRLMARGTSLPGVRVGSSPSVTPAIHATIGTGAYPKQHGIVDIFLRDGTNVVGSWDGQSPTFLKLPTLADLYDIRTGNQAKIALVAEKGWHLGMIGHGEATPGGDKDLAVMGSFPGKLFTNEDFYSLPGYLLKVPGFQEDLRRVDLADGRGDSAWLGHDLLPLERTRLSPVFTLYQNRLLQTLVKREQLGSDGVTDLLYTNYKQVDLIGHAYNMVNAEVGDALRYSDEALGHLVDLFNRTVGRNKWAMVVTADHGQTPLPQSVGAWPIEVNELERDVARQFGVDVDELIQRSRPGAMWFDVSTLERSGHTLKDVARYLLQYPARDNLVAGQVAGGYETRLSERLFASVFPYAWMPRVWRCAQDQASRE